MNNIRGAVPLLVVFQPLLEGYDERPELLRRHCADGGGFLLRGF